MKINKLKGIVMATATVLLLVGCTTNNSQSNNHDPKTEQNKSIAEVGKYSNVKNSTFLIKDGKIVENKDTADNTNIIDWYIDPYCPSCSKLETIMSPKLEELSSKMTIRYHTMNFLAPQSVDDYSTRAAAFLLASAEKAPDVTLNFIKKLMNDDFRPHVPKEGEDKNVAKKSDEQIKELFLSVKGTEEQWNEMISIKDDLMDMVRKSTAEAFNSKELVDKTVNGRLSVPLVIIGKSEKAIDFTEATDAESHFIDSVDKYLEKIKKDSEKKDESTPSSSEEKKDETKTESTKTDKSSS